MNQPIRELNEGGRFFAQVNTHLGLPFNSLCLTAGLVVIFGCIFLGSNSAFNAITSASVVALGISYGMPIAVNCLQMRRKLPPRPFVLPPILGWLFNIVGLVYIIVTTILFVFPPDLPVTGSNGKHSKPFLMNILFANESLCSESNPEAGLTSRSCWKC